MKKQKDFHKRKAYNLAKRLGWEDPVPDATLRALMAGTPVKVKQTNDLKKDFGRSCYGKFTHLSKRHYLERERWNERP
jgi:hypothetical protein